MALDRRGNVYSWGLNTQGALGLGQQIPATDKPQIIDKLMEADITQVSCGNHFTLFLTGRNEVKACGNNQLGQLGINKTNKNDIWFKPVAVNINEQVG